MAYTVKITYKGVKKDADRIGMNISRMFEPTGAYIDSKPYEGTVYDTNVEGWGETAMPEPFASTSIPFPAALAQFKLAIVGKSNEVSFDVEDYKEAFYYETLGDQMKDQGFVVEVSEKAAEVAGA